MTLTIKDLLLGRIAFPTIESTVIEALGDALDTTGAGLSAGERKPRSFPLTVPVRASDREANPYVDGERLRRQVRSLMENPQARLSGLYMKVAFDPELNGWLLAGGGNLEYGEGGVVFADYKLALSDVYMVGQQRSHRPGLRMAVTDRRLSTTPRDYEKSIYSTNFSGTAAVAAVSLPHGATDVRGVRNALKAANRSDVTADGGSASLYSSMLQGEVYSYEQPESAQNLGGDVLIHDRRGSHLAAPPGKTNFHRNPSAEPAGATTNWISSFTGWASGNLHGSASPFAGSDGAYVFRVEAAKDATGTQRTVSLSIATDIGDIKPGLAYSFRHIFNVTDNGGEGLRMLVNWYTATGVFLASSEVTPFFTGTGLKTLELLNQVAPAEAAQAILVIQVASKTSGDTVKIDFDCGQIQKGATLDAFFPTAAQQAAEEVIWEGGPNISKATIPSTEDPQAYGWEEVYGPNYPLTGEEVGGLPVLSNGLSRTRLSTKGPNWAFIQEVFTGGKWREQGRFMAASGGFLATAIISCVVKEWTPERAVIYVRFHCASEQNCDMYLTLQRGWRGPRVEAYTRAGGLVEQARIYYNPVQSGNMLLAKSDAVYLSSDATFTGTKEWATTIEPWGILAPESGTGLQHTFAMLCGGSGGMTTLSSENTVFYGVAHNGLIWRGTESGELTGGYVGVQMGFCTSDGVKVYEAETYRATGSGTTSEVADAEGSGGKVVNDTQITEANPTLQVPAASVGLDAGAQYAVFAKAKVVTSGTAKIRVGSGGPTGTLIKELTGTTLTWYPVGSFLQLEAKAFQLDMWRTAAGSARVDKVVMVPTSVPGLDACGDLGKQSLSETRAFAELVAR